MVRSSVPDERRAIMAKPWHKLQVVIVVGVTLLTAYNGIVEGINATHSAGTIGMKIATVTQLLYGGFGAAALIAMVLRRRWVSRLLAGWGFTLVATATLAPIVYADSSIGVGVALGGLVAAVAVFVLWVWRQLQRSSYAGGLGGREGM
jgi:hypothetical protein